MCSTYIRFRIGWDDNFGKIATLYLKLRYCFFAVSVLPEDDWFNDICQEAIDRLSGKPKAINGDRELNSPTASVSAQSISSVRSHSSS